MTNKPQLVVLEWNDAWCDATGVVTLKDVVESHKPMCVETIGWLLYEDSEGVSIANEKCADDTFRGRTYVLSGMVKHIRPYNLTKPRKPKGKSHDHDGAGTPASDGNSAEGPPK